MKSIIIKHRHKFGIITATILILLLCLCGCNANKEIDQSTVNLKEYELNGVIFSMPEFWVLKTEHDDSMSFSITNDDNENMVIVRSEIIPEIMKIDVGENSILSKTDVINHYALYQSIDCSVEEKQWLSTDCFDYFKAFFSDIEMSYGSGNQSGVSITIPINENEAVFDITIISDDENDLKLIDKILESIVITSATVSKVSLTEQIYKTVSSLTVNDLTMNNGRYYYNNLIISTEDEKWLKSNLNTKGTLEHGALYRTIANYLEGFTAGINNGSSYCKIMCNLEWTSKSDFEPYVNNAKEFICNDDPLKKVMKKFASMNSVQGDFDFEYDKFGKFNLDISDLSACADEMQISEEMLGYIFAMLDEYGTKITFSGNGCHIEYTSYN